MHDDKSKAMFDINWITTLNRYFFFFLEFCKTASYSYGWIWYGSIQTMNFQS